MKKGKIVTLATQKGGTGKSTLCLSIGHALHKHFGVKVAIVDSDEQASALSFYGQRRITANEPELEGFDMSFPEVAKLNSSGPYRKQLERITEFYDVVLVDTKGEFQQFQLDLIRMSDYVLSPVQASEFDLEPTKLVRDAVEHENTQRDGRTTRPLLHHEQGKPTGQLDQTHRPSDLRYGLQRNDRLFEECRRCFSCFWFGLHAD